MAKLHWSTPETKNGKSVVEGIVSSSSTKVSDKFLKTLDTKPDVDRISQVDSRSSAKASNKRLKLIESTIQFKIKRVGGKACRSSSDPSELKQNRRLQSVGGFNVRKDATMRRTLPFIASQ